MGKLVNPHGSKELKCLLLEGKAREDETKKAKGLKKVPLTRRETGDLIMLGIGGFTPLDGFMGQADWKGISESYIPEQFKGLYQRPAEARKMFEERGWNTVAALQLRNPMHGSHAYLAWIAIEVCDGVYIHQLVGKLKPGDIPADVRVKAIDALINKYFRKERVAMAGYPLDMRYAGPREALLHAVFRQNYGCSHLIVGRDHAGVGDYYGPFDAQKIFLEIPQDALLLKPLCMDWTFYCYECGAMASMKTCPHESKAVIDDNGNYKGGARLLLSGTLLRKLMSEGKPVPSEFSKPEVIAVLNEYYNKLEQKVEVKLHGAATGDVKKN